MIHETENDKKKRFFQNRFSKKGWKGYWNIKTSKEDSLVVEKENGKKNPCVEIISTTEFEIRKPTKQVLDVLFEMKAEEKKKELVYILPLNRYYEFISRLPNVFLKKNQIPKEVLQSVIYKQEKNPIDLSSIGELLMNSLYDFQKEGIEETIRRKGRIIIADDMGLGKTIQALAISKYYKDEWPVLIIAPSSLTQTWRMEIEKWYSDIPFKTVLNINNGGEYPEGDINIVSYDIATKISSILFKKRFKVVILDECHYIKNAETKRAKELIPILIQAERTLLLSGTPAPSRPIELFTQIQIIAPTLFRDIVSYGMRYCGCYVSKFGYDMKGATNKKELQVLLKKLILIRRTKEDSLKGIPEKKRNLKYIYIQEEEENDVVFLDAFEKNLEIMRKWKNCCMKKFNRMFQIIHHEVREEKNLIVFCHHSEMIKRFEEEFERKGISFVKIDGGVDRQKRQNICNLFQNTENIQVCLLSITAAGIGLTLTKATEVFFCELYWNPGVLLQAEDRAYRIGQKQNVTINYFIGIGTIDEKIWNLVIKKMKTIQSIGIGKCFQK